MRSGSRSTEPHRTHPRGPRIDQRRHRHRPAMAVVAGGYPACATGPAREIPAVLPPTDCGTRPAEDRHLSRPFRALHVSAYRNGNPAIVRSRITIRTTDQGGALMSKQKMLLICGIGCNGDNWSEFAAELEACGVSSVATVPANAWVVSRIERFTGQHRSRSACSRPARNGSSSTPLPPRESRLGTCSRT